MGPFPPGFFARADPTPDSAFYAAPRLVNHIDDGAIAAVGELYEELGIAGRVLDLMSSWVSHFRTPPAELVGLGMNARELAANPALVDRVGQDLNADPVLPFADASFDHAVCCVSVDYLVRPLEVFAEVARVLRPGGLFVCTFSNRCFATKAIRGWLAAGEQERVAIVRRYFELSEGFGAPEDAVRRRGRRGADPLWGVWAQARAGYRARPDAASARRPGAEVLGLGGGEPAGGLDADEEGPPGPLGGPGVARVVVGVVDPRQRAVTAGEGVDPAELPVGEGLGALGEEDRGQGTGEAELAREMVVGPLLPARAPHEVEGLGEGAEVIAGALRKEVGDPVDHEPAPARTNVQPRSEQGDDPVDVDQEEGSGAVLEQSGS